jgi:DNA topoisomerase-1
MNKTRNKNKILLIVESPAKCSTIVSHLGADKYVCVATFGHMTELTSLKDIDTTFASVPQFHIVDSKTKTNQIEKIRALVAECKETYLMTDNDREGAGIAYHACCLFGLPVTTTKRVLFNEITKPALERAIQSPQPLNMDAVHAQIARQAMDMLVGFKITPTLWAHVHVPVPVNQGSSLSAGRCQTPALRLIYDNQRAIDAADGRISFDTVGYFTKLNLKYELSKGHDAAEACSAFLLASAEFKHVICEPELRPFSKPAPTPLTTCSLQQQASNELNLSPADTMAACQHLYEGGFITYPRTDSRAYSEPFLEHARAYIAEKWGDNYNKGCPSDMELEPGEDKPPDKKKKRIVIKRKKETKTATATATATTNDPDDVVKDVKPQEAHEAVHVTSLHCVAVPDTMTPKEQRLYRMIWRHSAETCMAPCTGKTLTSRILAPDQREYRYSVERTEFAGWRIVAETNNNNNHNHKNKSDDAVTQAHWSFLQAIAPGSVIKYNKLQSRMTIRDVKSHYSEASLVSMLEERGIGRPSTFSSLVHKIQERGYVTKQDVTGRRVNCVDYELDGGVLTRFVEEREFGNEKNRLVITPMGRAVTEFLCAHFAELFDYDYTKRMEQQLDQVSSGEKPWGDVCGECLSCVDRLLHKLNSNQPTTTTTTPTTTTTTPTTTPPTTTTTTPTTTTTTRPKNLCKLLGKYNGNDLFLRTGKYGPYLTWGDQKQSFKPPKPHDSDDSDATNNAAMTIDVDEVPCSYDDAVRCIESSVSTTGGAAVCTNPSILREINASTSVRAGQYGPYIYYKNPKMKIPAFVSLRGFKEDWKTCDLRLLDTWATSNPVKPPKK